MHDDLEKWEPEMEEAWVYELLLEGELPTDQEHQIWILNKLEIKFYHICALNMLRFVSAASVIPILYG